MNEIVKFTDDSGLAVQVTPDDVRRYICENATEKEVGLFLQLCRTQRLNPFVKDAYLVKYGSAPASMITAYQVFNRRACRDANYDGIKSGVVVLSNGAIERRRGSAVYKQLGDELLGGWAEVRFKDGREPAYAELALTDYSTGKSNWAKMPGVMIEKCAKATAWRLAFPDTFQGMYTAEEMDQAEPPQPEQVQPEPVQRPVDLQPIRELFKPYCEHFGITPAEGMAAVCGAVGAEDMHSMTEQQARRARAWMEEEMAAPVVEAEYEVVDEGEVF